MTETQHLPSCLSRLCDSPVIETRVDRAVSQQHRACVQVHSVNGVRRTKELHCGYTTQVGEITHQESTIDEQHALQCLLVLDEVEGMALISIFDTCTVHPQLRVVGAQFTGDGEIIDSGKG